VRGRDDGTGPKKRDRSHREARDAGFFFKSNWQVVFGGVGTAVVAAILAYIFSTTEEQQFKGVGTERKNW